MQEQEQHKFAAIEIMRARNEGGKFVVPGEVVLIAALVFAAAETVPSSINSSFRIILMAICKFNLNRITFLRMAVAATDRITKFCFYVDSGLQSGATC